MIGHGGFPAFVLLFSRRSGAVPCDIALRSLFWGSPLRDFLARIFCEAIEGCGQRYLSDCVDVERVEGGSLQDSFAFRGVVLRKSPSRLRMPRYLEGGKVLVLDRKLYINLKGEGIRFLVRDPSELEKVREIVKGDAKRIVDLLKRLDVKLIVNLKGIDPIIEEALELNGIVVVKRIPEEKFKLLLRATGAKLVGGLEEATEEKLGVFSKMEERVFGSRRYLFLEAPKGGVVTVILRGPWYHVDSVYEEVRMAARGAEVYARDPRVLPAGGAPEVEAILKIREFGKRVGSKKQLAFEAYADALKIIPETLARHSGLDPLETVTELERMHAEGYWSAGINEDKRTITSDVIKEGLVDIYEIRRGALEAGVMLAITFLRLTGVYVSKKGENLRRIRYES
jgi:chaperonin GroEL (HSP60 family)